ncbi:MAG: chitin synthase-domain-containing protein [Olpidium bornovanus]|uniref:Chitin synthase-domain-containing protein n=1 Tax=Olpidium bornovanus TaxID=278681 RepID=A0A8H7ZS83_9FUNG|nr:MAG: chitin synthase-domain-containing protein [Olpidium bornovanus]
MLRKFPKRKMIFVPKAVCKTVVPARFQILLSQRRRWINSTVHNLFELLFVGELCGTFCFSMQFVVLLEMIGTLTLPAAFVLSMYAASGTNVSGIPLVLLFAILGLPMFLILLTMRKAVYVYWMAVYLFALPIWNLVLPVYAYWHFDDFSWGKTRKVAGEKGGSDHGAAGGELDPGGSVPCKRWHEWERERLARSARGGARPGVWSTPASAGGAAAWDWSRGMGGAQSTGGRGGARGEEEERGSESNAETAGTLVDTVNSLDALGEGREG